MLVDIDPYTHMGITIRVYSDTGRIVLYSVMIIPVRSIWLLFILGIIESKAEEPS